MADVFLGLGSNLGDKVANIKKALDTLKDSGAIQIKAVSSLYEGESVGAPSQPDFLNCVARVQTDLDPHELLKKVKAVESQMGREPETHLQPRSIDIDILLYDDIDLESLDLMIPHSRLRTRRFVLEPLLEIDPGLVDPVFNRPFEEYLKNVSTQRLKRVMDSREVLNA